MDLPDPFEDAIQLSEVKKQEIMRAKAARDKSKVEIQTMLITADMNKNVTINIAEGEADAHLKEKKSFSASYNVTEMAMITGYAKLKEALKMQNNGELLAYMRAKIVRQHQGKIIAQIHNADSFSGGSK